MLHSFLGCFRASQIGCVGCSPSEESVRKFVRNSLSIRPWMASQERPVTRSTLRPTTRVASVSDDSTPHFYLPFTYALPTSASYQCLLPVPPSPCTYALPTCSSVYLRFTYLFLRVPTRVRVRSPSPFEDPRVEVFVEDP